MDSEKDAVKQIVEGMRKLKPDSDIGELTNNLRRILDPMAEYIAAKSEIPTHRKELNGKIEEIRKCAKKLDMALGNLDHFTESLIWNEIDRRYEVEGLDHFLSADEFRSLLKPMKNITVTLPSRKDIQQPKLSVVNMYLDELAEFYYIATGREPKHNNYYDGKANGVYFEFLYAARLYVGMQEKGTENAVKQTQERRKNGTAYKLQQSK